MNKKKKPSEDTKIKIIQAALEEFTIKGYSGARTDRIAKNAGVNKAMLYYYYNSKEELYRKALEYTFERKNHDSLYESAVHELNSNTEKFCFIIFMIVKMHFQHYDHAIKKLLHWQRVEDTYPILHKLVEKYVHPQYKKIIEIVKNGMKENEFIEGNPSMPVYLLINSVVHYHEMETFFNGSVLYDDIYNKNKMELLIESLIRFVLEPMLVDSKNKKKCNYEKIDKMTDRLMNDMLHSDKK